MKVSVSLPEGDLDFVDAYAKAQGIPSRSAVLHEAIQLLRMSNLEAAYEAAFTEWDASEDKVLWDSVSADGLD